MKCDVMHNTGSGREAEDILKHVILYIVLAGILWVSTPKLHAQADVYTGTFLTLDQDNWDMIGYSAMIATYDVLFYYEVMMDTTMLLKDGKNLDVSSTNSSDDEYLIAEVSAAGIPGATVRVSTRVGLSAMYRKRNQDAYDVFNFKYWSSRGISRRNYAHFIGKGPAQYIKDDDSDWPSDAEKPIPGALTIDVQKGRAWRGGGSVVLDKTPTTPITLTAKGMEGQGKFRWAVGPKLALIGSSTSPQIRIRGSGRSGATGVEEVSLTFTSRTGKQQNASIRITIREPASLLRFDPERIKVQRQEAAKE